MSGWLKFWKTITAVCSKKGTRQPTRFRLESLEERLTPATFNVVSTADSLQTAALTPIGGGVFNAPSLRAAIAGSNATTGPNTINLTVPGTYQITIPGGATADNSAGQFAIKTNSVTINNTSGSPVVIDGGGGNSRVFDIAPDNASDNINVTIGSLLTPSITIQHGNSGGIAVGVGGNSSSLTLNNAIVTNNHTSAASLDGGGIALNGNGSLTLNSCSVSNNQSFSATGGGIAADNTGSGGNIIINNSTIAGNFASGDGGGLNVVSGRGGITAVSVNNSTISNNTANGAGGGISTKAGSTISLNQSLLAGNTAGTTGGGIDAAQLPVGSSVSISDSEITHNFSGSNGGGLSIGGSELLSIVRTTIDNNTASSGGGIYYTSSAANSGLTNVTMTGNTAVNDSGAIRAAFGTLMLVHDTIAGNTAGGFGVGGVFASSGSIRLENTIIAGNLLGPNASTGNGTDIGTSSGGTFTSQGGNFIGNPNGAIFVGVGGDQVGGTGTAGVLNLGPLANNGGLLIGAPGSQTTIPTLTELPGSTTIDRGLTSGLSVDERGFTRPDLSGSVTENGFPDIGAVELHDGALSVTVSAPGTPPLGVSPTAKSLLLVTVSNTSTTPLPDDNSTVTVTLGAGLTAISGPTGSTVNGNVITFRVGRVGANSSVSFNLFATGNTVGNALVSVSVSSPDATSTGGSATVPVLTAQQRFVQALYLNELGRSGAISELNGWVALLNSPAGPQGLVAAIEGTFEARDYLVRGWYQTFLGRQALNNEELVFVTALQYQSEEQTLSLLLGSQEFFAHTQGLIGGPDPNTNFVQALYKLLLNRTGSAGEVAPYLEALPAIGPTAMALLFLQGDEYRYDTIQGYYNTLLHRPYDEGYLGWYESILDLGSVRMSFEATPEFFSNG